MKNKVIGTTDIGAFRHRDNNGEIKIELVSAVNKPFTVEKHDETTPIFVKRFKTTEEEIFDIRPHQSYTKKFKPIQEDIDTPVNKEQKQTTQTSSKYDPNDDLYDEDEQPKQNSPLSKEGHFLKNMVDNLWSDIRQMRDHNVLLIVGIICSLVLSAVAFTVMVLK